MLREINGILRQTNLPNESEEYLVKRDELRRAEIDLRNQRERVAELRRQLPQGPAVEDYVFEEVSAKLDSGDTPIQKTRLSGLFTKPDRSVVIYHFMFGKKQMKPCPMCSAWIDGFNAVAHHLAQNLDFAIVAAADLASLRSYARTRGWNRLRLLSAGSSTFKYDLGSENKEGDQDSAMSVFTHGNDGTIRHSYTGHPWLAPDIKERGIDELTPIWNIMDLIREGRGTFYTKLEYPGTA
jgi:predicted dithiol-disulfide oxidoreductase (DUF899 family)